MTRRECIKAMSAMAIGVLGGCKMPNFGRRRIALNPSTIREFHLSFVEQVKLAAECGYDGIEPWLRDLRAAKANRTLGMAMEIANDNGLEFVNGIAFGQWVNPDAKIRAEGIAETRRNMDLLAEIGCRRIAASMFGMHKVGARKMSLEEIAERYARVLDLGREHGVRPMLEYWGHSVNLSTPEEALKVVRMVKRDDAAVLPDVYHTHRGGGDIATLAGFRAGEIPVLHVNDYPLGKSRETLCDSDRVWPGDGGADWRRIFLTLDAMGADPWLSLELFNSSYQKNQPEDTLRTGLEKVRGVCR